MADEADARPARGKARSARRKAVAALALAQTPRPKRTKKTLGDDFLAAVRADFRAHGAGVIAEVRADKPDQYLKIVLSVLPKDFDVAVNHLDVISDILFEVIVRKFRPAREE
jgi:formate dehydrogenase maturation protein FdhE